MQGSDAMVTEPNKVTDEEIQEALEKEKREEEKLHQRAVEDTFPASDPPATTQPNSGITGPEVARENQ
jgi:hypothetical protein